MIPAVLGALKGLSPRVRGNQFERRVAGITEGAIPASAGEPAANPPPGQECQGYPRECGGTGPPTGSRKPERGLSPRVRGNPEGRGAGRRILGAIPASAGEPITYCKPREINRGYPRECGGTSDSGRGPSGEGGLSPRVRGNPSTPPVRAARRRAIPASAGEPVSPHLARQLRQGYPRECGGTVIRQRNTSGRQGLSPRVRGNRSRGRSMRRDSRAIPASAGEP